MDLVMNNGKVAQWASVVSSSQRLSWLFNLQTAKADAPSAPVFHLLGPVLVL